MTTKNIAISMSSIILLVVVSLITKVIVLGDTDKTSLITTSSPIAGAVSRSINSSQTSNNPPLEGKNFKLQSTNYFDDKQWAVSSVTTIPDNDTAIVVLQEVNGSYQVVVGPGTIFSSQQLQAMPSDVVNYLTSLGVVANAAL